MELHDYQKRCADFIAAHPNCILSVDMGLGKTAAVLEYIRRYNPSTLLIVAPKRVAENNWHTEAQKWGLDEIYGKMIVCAGTAKKRALALKDDTHPYKIISRDNIKDCKWLSFDLLVIDELTSFKSIEAARTKAVMSIKAKRKVGLTGTFLANGAIDIYGQASAVGLSFNGYNFFAWRATYFRDALAGSGLAFHKWKLNVPLEAVLKPIQDNIFTLTASDYLHIPAVSYETRQIELTDSERTQYENADAFLQLNIGDEILSVNERAKFAKLQTLCNGFVYLEDGSAVRSGYCTKLEAVADFVLDCKEAGEPVLLFYSYREEALWLHELLTARGVKCESVKKAGFLERWNAGQTECLFAHPASAGHGLNMQTGGRICVWSSVTWNYELWAQGNARLARQGQTRQVRVVSFVAKDTCEAGIVAALARKDKEQNQFLTLTKQ